MSFDWFEVGLIVTQSSDASNPFATIRQGIDVVCCEFDAVRCSMTTQIDASRTLHLAREQRTLIIGVKL